MRIMALIMLVISSQFAFAADTDDSKVAQKPLVGETLESFNQDVAKVEAGMHPGGRYEFISPAERSRVEAGFAQMRDILTRNAGQSDLKIDDKVVLFNTQEQVNGILTHTDRNRLVCEHSLPVGSHIPVTSCHTLAEIMREHQILQHDLEHGSAMLFGARCPPGKPNCTTTGTGASRAGGH